MILKDSEGSAIATMLASAIERYKFPRIRRATVSWPKALSAGPLLILKERHTPQNPATVIFMISER
jgi:hypothetical protein